MAQKGRNEIYEEEIIRLISIRVDFMNKKIIQRENDDYSDLDNYHRHLSFNQDGSIHFSYQFHDCPECDYWFAGDYKDGHFLNTRIETR